MRALLAKNSGIRFAIANPEHAPYGRAAEAALRARGLWDVLQPSLVLGENISQTAQFATAGGAAGGIIAYSLVLAPALKGRGTYALIPDATTSAAPPAHGPAEARRSVPRSASTITFRAARARALFAQARFRAPQ